MANIIMEFSKYVLIIFMAFYTLECFVVFRHATEEARNGIYIRQNILMFLIHFISFVVLCLETKNSMLILMYAVQQLSLFATIAIYRVVYPRANRLIVNNMCMLLTISFIILTRLSLDRSMKQFSIVAISIIFTMVVPQLMKKIKVISLFPGIYGAIGLCALSVVMVLGKVTNGSKLSYSIGGFTFQPSEFVKILFVLSVAGLLSKSTELKQVIFVTIMAGAHVIVLVLSKDLGSALIYFVVYVLMLYIASKKWIYLLAGVVSAVAASIVGFKLFPHVRVRVQAWKDPWSTIEAAGYQITQSLFAIGTGGFFGMGLEQGAPNKIPVVESDFIFSAISEEMGGIFAACLILVCVSCFIMFMNISMRLHDKFYKLIAVGLGIEYGFQVFLTIGGVIKFIPLTGVTLPLVSYGGTSVLTTLIMFAIIQGLYIIENDDSKEKAKEKTIEKKKENKESRKEGRREIANATYLFVGLFMIMLGYFMYYVGVKAPSQMNSSYNSRQELMAQKVVRGKIYSRDREVLAETIVNADGTETRNYPYGSVFAQTVGFSTNGKTGIESLANFSLLTSNAYVGERIQNTIAEKKNIGDNVITTLDVNLQKTASEALGIYKGAIIAMDPATGQILAMVSKPDFDPNQVVQNWNVINEDQEAGPLLNRATQGLYPGGSTFKIVTLLEYLREHPTDYEEYSFDCSGKFSIEDQTINCYHGISHGQENLLMSFAKSCNSSFANISTGLNKKSFQKTCEELLFNQELPVSFHYKESYVPINAASPLGEVMQTAIGQGKTQITPLHMAMITATISNDGLLMEPYLIEQIENYNQNIVESYEPKEYGRLMTETEAVLMNTFMEEVVQSGTATKLKGLPYTAAGKTGSAEYSSDKSESHAWFTGYATMNDRRIVVTVIVEGAGSGGDYAAPMAKRVFDAYFAE